jgi:hypothetical protein
METGVRCSHPTGKPTTTALLLIDRCHRRRIDFTDRQTAPEPGRRQDHKGGTTVQFLRRNDLLSLLIFIGSRIGSAPITVQIANPVQPTGRARTCSSAARCPAVVPTAVFALPQRFFVRGILAGAVTG